MPASFLHPLVACIGDPVAENPTEVMINAAFKAMGLDWIYLTIEVKSPDLAAAVRGFRACQFRGFNCTIPHKVAVIPHLDQLSPAAEMIGAVNCVVIRDGKLTGENTDGKGFLQSLSAVRPVPGSRVAILGAGGAARAISVELARAGAAEVTVVNRDPMRGQTLSALVRERTGVPSKFVAWKGDYIVPKDVDVIVNATPIGLFPDVDARIPLEADSLRPDLLVCDVIPNPPETRLIRDASSRGCVTLDGLGMLVNQGVIGIQLWTGQDPDPSVMRRALEQVFDL
jgi:shikimate dehydrogenase